MREDRETVLKLLKSILSPKGRCFTGHLDVLFCHFKFKVSNDPKRLFNNLQSENLSLLVSFQ